MSKCIRNGNGALAEVTRSSTLEDVLTFVRVMRQDSNACCRKGLKVRAVLLHRDYTTASMQVSSVPLYEMC